MAQTSLGNGALCTNVMRPFRDPACSLTFRFIHTADLHLDSPLKTLALRDPELGAVIANATRMVQQVTIRNAAHVPARLLIGFAASVGALCGAALLGLATVGQAALAAFLAGDPVLIDHARPVLFICSLVPLEVALRDACMGLLISAGDTRAVSIGAWLGTIVTLATCAVAVFYGAEGAASAALAMVAGCAVELATLGVALKLRKSPADAS